MSLYSFAIRVLGAGRRLRRRRRSRRLAARFAQACRSDDRQPAAILLLERLGDFVAASAIVAGIRERHPELRIAWFGRARYRELAMLVPGVDDYIDIDCYGELKDVVDSLRDWRLFDLNLNGKQCACCATPWHNRTAETAIDTENYYDQGPLAVAFAKVAGLTWQPGSPSLRIPDVTTPALPERYVVIHSESEESARNWHEAGWRELAAWLLQHTDLHIAHVGVRPANWLPASERAVDLAGQTDQAQLMAVVARCRLFIGIDSSVANLANAYQRPGLVLLGRYRRFARYLPYTGNYALDERGGAALVVRHPSECPYLPYDVVERALHTAARRLRAELPLGRGGAWDVRTHELPVDTGFAAQDAEPDVAALLTVRDVTAALAWLSQWPGEAAELVFVLPADAHIGDDELERLEACGARFALAALPADSQLTDSFRYLRWRGAPAQLGNAATTPRLLDADAAPEPDIACDAARWYSVDVREQQPQQGSELLAKLHARICSDRTQPLVMANQGAVIIPRPDEPHGGLKSGIDHVERASDGSVTAISGWSFLESTQTPPASYSLCERRDDGSFAIRHRAPFSRLERPDVAQAFAAPGATFSGLRIEVPKDLRSPNLTVLVSDRAVGCWKHLELP